MIFITGSQGKYNEAKSVFPSITQLCIDLPEIQEINPKKIIEYKMREALKHAKENLIIEDTSLYMDSLNGLPGPLIKWFLATIGNEGIYEISRKLDNHDAVMKTIIGYADSPDEIIYFEGETKGSIVEPEGSSGFGWDPVFSPADYNKSFGELGIEEKNKCSARIKALMQLKGYLDNK